jgi:hypothetical protein
VCANRALHEASMEPPWEAPSGCLPLINPSGAACSHGVVRSTRGAACAIVIAKGFTRAMCKVQVGVNIGVESTRCFLVELNPSRVNKLLLGSEQVPTQVSCGLGARAKGQQLVHPPARLHASCKALRCVTSPNCSQAFLWQ